MKKENPIGLDILIIEDHSIKTKINLYLFILYYLSCIRGYPARWKIKRINAYIVVEEMEHDADNAQSV